MKKYYLMAIEHKCVKSMYSFGDYYEKVEKDYKQMKKYYLMAIEHNCVKSMYNLGNYYEKVEKDYKQMKKYYLMAIEHNCVKTMYDLENYYKNIDKNIDTNEELYDEIKIKGITYILKNKNVFVKCDMDELLYKYFL